MNFQAVAQANGKNVIMFATFNEIGGISYTQNQKQVCVCKITDDNVEQHTVRLYGTMPGPALLNQRQQFNISTYQGTHDGRPYTGYSGFWNNKAQVAPQNSQYTPSQPAQATTSQQPTPQGKKEPDWDAKDLRMARMNALTNATKLVCLIAESNKEYIDDAAQDPTLLTLIRKSAEVLVNYIYNGLPTQTNVNPDYVGDNPPKPTDNDIPF